MSEGSTTIKILEDFKDEILDTWRDKVREGDPLTFELITDDEYDAQSRSLIDKIISNYRIQIEDYRDFYSSQFDELRAIADEISASRVGKKFMSTNFLVYHTALSETILRFLNDKIADSELLTSESEYLTSFMENLAILMFESFLTSIENLVKSAPDRFRLEQKLKGLHVHAFQLNQAKSIQQVVNHTIDAMISTLGLSMAGIFMVEGDYLREIRISGLPFRLDPNTRKRSRITFHLDGRGIVLKAFKTKRTIHLPDTREDPDYISPKELQVFGAHRDWRSELTVPVVADDDVIAVLNVESTDLDAFSVQDQELMETLASHVASAIQRIKNRERVRELAYRLNNLEPGGSYLSESHERCLKAYAVLSMEGVPGLCIVREDPQLLMDRYGINKEDIVLLSSRPFEDYRTLADLQLVSRALSRFLESGEGVVLLDGLEYLISRYGFDSVYHFVQEKRFDFLRSKAVLLVPLEMKTLNERQQALLSSEFKLLE